MSKLRERTEALLPGKDIQQKRGRVASLMATLAVHERAAERARREMSEAIIRAVAGDDIDLLDYARRDAEALAEAEAARKINAELIAYNQQLAGEQTTIEETDTRAALSFLRGELQLITSDVAALDLILGNITTASDAIRAGHAESWSKLEDLVGEYDEIRRLQAEIYSSIRGVVDHESIAVMCHAGLLADALTRDGNVLILRQHRAQMSPNQYPNEKTWRRWLLSAPADGGLPPRASSTDWWPDGDRIDYLRRVATTATPWLPDYGTLAAAAEALAGATHETRGNGVTASFEEARARYAELTGTEL